MNFLAGVALALVLVLSLLAAARAEITIDPKNHVANEPPGYCMWDSLEMVGRHLGVKQLAGLAQSRKKDGGFYVDEGMGMTFVPNNPGHPIAVRMKLEDLGVKFEMQWPGKTDTAILTKALAANRPVVVGVRLNGSHAVVLTHLDDKTVRLVDPNYPGQVRGADRYWFDHNWTGYAVDILP